MALFCNKRTMPHHSTILEAGRNIVRRRLLYSISTVYASNLLSINSDFDCGRLASLHHDRPYLLVGYSVGTWSRSMYHYDARNISIQTLLASTRSYGLAWSP